MNTLKSNFKTQINNHHTYFITFLFLFNLVGCFQSTDKINSDHVKSEDIHQAYNLFYDGNANKTEFYGTFRVGGVTGTTVELVSPGKLLINNLEADVDRTYGVHYSKLLRDGDVRTVSVQWITNEGLSYINNYYIPGATFNDSFNFRLSIHQPTYIGVDAPGYDESHETFRLEVIQVDENNINNDGCSYNCLLETN